MNSTRDSGRFRATDHTTRLRVGTTLLPIVVAIFSLTACERREPADKPMSRSETPSTTAPTAQYPARPESDMTDPSKRPGTDTTEKSGGPSAGAGTGAAEPSTSKEETKTK